MIDVATWSGEPGDGPLGDEFYAGDATRIGSACARGEWQALRQGAFSTVRVLFPDFVHSLDIGLLAEAVAEVTGRPEVELDHLRSVASGPEELWGAAVIVRPWVAALAAVDLVDIPRLRLRWKELHLREYEPGPGEPHHEDCLQLVEQDWMHESMLHACEELVALARTAIGSSLDVVNIWCQ